MHQKGESLGGAYALAEVREGVPSLAWRRWASLPGIAVCMSLTFGMVLVFLTAPFQSPGEFQHFYRAYQVSEGQWAASYQGNVGGGYLPVSLTEVVKPFYDLRFHGERKTSAAQISESLKVPLNSDQRDFVAFITALYSPVGYLPEAAAIAVGRWAGLTPLELMYLGRLANLLCWTLLVYLSLKIAPCCRRPMFMLMFMPMSIFLAASLSIDALTNGLSVLVAAIVLRHAVDADDEVPGKNMEWGTVIVLGVATAAVTVSKIAYLPLSGLLLLVPAKRLGGRGRYAAIVIGIILFNVLALAAWEPFTRGLDVRVHDYENVSPRGQIAYLLSHPAALATVPTVTVLQNAWYILRSFVGRLGWVDTQLSPVFLMIYLGVMVAACIPAQGDPMPPRRKRSTVVVLVCTAAAIAAVGLLNYIYWTPVGDKSVTGIQGRYFIPLAPALVILLGSLWGWRLPERQWLRDPARQNATAAAFAMVACLYTVAAVYFRYYGSTGH
jgi:uncharacterized membrane protein